LIAHLAEYIAPSAYALLPQAMRSDEATAMLLAIALQESGCTHRRQVRGPARSFWQFEVGGVIGVLRHPATSTKARTVLELLCYSRNLTSAEILVAMEDNDTLACCFARLNLWWLPGPLPGPDESALGYQQYLASWRPGKPHPNTWPSHYSAAWKLVMTQRET
jgi:hypothetical protein